MSKIPLLTLRGHAANLVIADGPVRDGGARPCEEHALRSALLDVSGDAGNLGLLRRFAVRHDLVRGEYAALHQLFEAIALACRGRFSAFITPDVAPETAEISASEAPGASAQYGGVRQVGPWGEPKKAPPPPPPPPPPPQRRQSRPSSSSETHPEGSLAPGSPAAQAHTREEAARLGVPFCEVCEKARLARGG